MRILEGDPAPSHLELPIGDVRFALGQVRTRDPSGLDEHPHDLARPDRLLERPALDRRLTLGADESAVGGDHLGHDVHEDAPELEHVRPLGQPRSLDGRAGDRGTRAPPERLDDADDQGGRVHRLPIAGERTCPLGPHREPAAGRQLHLDARARDRGRGARGLRLPVPVADRGPEPPLRAEPPLRLLRVVALEDPVEAGVDQGRVPAQGLLDGLGQGQGERGGAAGRLGERPAGEGEQEGDARYSEHARDLLGVRSEPSCEPAWALPRASITRSAPVPRCAYLA